MNEWFADIVVRMFGLIHSFEADNFDGYRYREMSGKEFFVDQHAQYLLLVVAERASLFAARSLLADEYSRRLFDRLVLYRLLGHMHVRLPLSAIAIEQARDAAAEWEVQTTSDSGILGMLSVFAVPFENDIVFVKCWRSSLAAAVFLRQYYFDRGGIRIRPELGDVVLDVGGCFGDTAVFFAKSVGETGHVYTFDPVPKHCSIIRETLRMNPGIGKRITLFDFGLFDADREASEPARDVIDPGARISNDLSVRKLDSIELPKVDFIKMDVEGSELAALRGAEQTLRRFRPKLAISLYHRPDDLFRIPLWLHDLGLGYRFFLDHYSCHQEETVLYAAV